MCLEGTGCRKTVGRPRFSSELLCCVICRHPKQVKCVCSLLVCLSLVVSCSSLSHYQQLAGNACVFKSDFIG